MTAGSYEGAEWLPARKREWKMDQCIKKRLIAMSLSIVMCFGLCGTGLASDSAVAQEVQGRAVQLRNPVITADNSMKAKQKVTWDCVWFGSYPQAEVVPSSEDYASVKEDMRTEKEVIEDDRLFRTLQNLDESVWDENGDTEVSGSVYRRLKKSEAVYSTSGYSNHYDWQYETDAYHYFKYEPIKWRVLKVEDGQALLLSDIALDNQKYHTEAENITWEKSTIRSWLNGYGASYNGQGIDYSAKSFFNCAFSRDEILSIVDTSVVNNDNSHYKTVGGKDTEDKIFLLSESETYGENAVVHGFSAECELLDEARSCKSSIYGKAMGIWSNDSNEYKGCCHWPLRSPGNMSQLAVNVYDTGYVNIYGRNIYGETYGIRPALNLDSEAGQWKYAGTVCSDGTVDENAEGEDEPGGDEPAEFLSFDVHAIVGNMLPVRQLAFMWTDEYVNPTGNMRIKVKNESSPDGGSNTGTSGGENVENVEVTCILPENMYLISDDFAEDVDEGVWSTVIPTLAPKETKTFDLQVKIKEEKMRHYFGDTSITVYVTGDPEQHVTEFPVVSNSLIQFTIQKDNNSFSNGNMGSKFKEWTYETTTENLDRLAANKHERNSLLKFMETTPHTGSCEGICALMGLVFQGKIRLEDLGQEVQTFYELEMNKALMHTVNYYQLFQKTSRYKADGSIKMKGFGKTSKSKRREVMSDFIDAVKEDPVLVLYSYEYQGKEESHAVLAVSAQEGNSGEPDVIKIIDPNKTKALDTYSVPEDGDWMNMEIFNSLGTMKRNITIFNYITLDSFLKKLGDKHDGSELTRVEYCGPDSFTLIAGNGKSLKIQGAEITGNTELIEEFSTIGEGSTVRYYIELPKDTSYSVIPSSENIDISICNDEMFASVDVSGAEQIDCSAENGIAIKGTDIVQKSFISTKDENSTMLSVSGNAGNSLVIQPTSKGTIVSASHAKGMSAVSYGDGGNSTSAIPDDSANVLVQTGKDGGIALKDPSGKDEIEKNTPVKVQRIKISGISKKIAAGKKIRLEASVQPSNAKNKNVTWKSSNTKIAKVNQSGIVTLNKKSGKKKVTITAFAADGSGVKAAYKITSMKGVVKKVAITGKKTMAAGKSQKLKAKVTAAKGANKKLQWKSSNTKYATVTGSGKVKTKRAGKGKTVKITAMATDGSGKKASVKIRLK